MQKRKKIGVFILFLCLLLTIYGCGTSDTKPVEKGKTFTDALGREVKISSPPQKVISLSPAITEILFALELDEKIIGTTEYCDYPEEAKNKPKMGNFENPNFELIVDSEPDLVFIAAGIQTSLIEKFNELNIKVFCLDAETVEQVISNIELAGQIMDANDKAKALSSKMKEKLSTIQEKIQGQEKPLVFFEIWDDPLMSAGPGTFINNLIELAGGINLAKDAATRYPQINFEVLVDKNPDIYIAINHQRKNDITNRPNFQSLKAIQEGKIYTIEDDLVTLPGPRIIMGLEEMAKIIHPELFN